MIWFGCWLSAAAAMGFYYGRLRFGSEGALASASSSLLAAMICIPLYAALSGRADRTFALVLAAGLVGLVGFSVVVIWSLAIVVCCIAVLDSILIPHRKPSPKSEAAPAAVTPRLAEVGHVDP
jgi:hypothetical protein